MSISSSDEEFLVGILENAIVYGQYHHLFLTLKEHAEQYFQYMRMTLDTFSYILGKIEHF